MVSSFFCKWVVVSILWLKLWEIYVVINHHNEIWFHEIFSSNQKTQFARHSVEKREIHCHAKFFSSNQLRVKFFSKKLISRNFCEKMVAVKFRNFHTVLHWTVQCGKTRKKCFPWNQLYINFLNNPWFHELFSMNDNLTFWQI